jgi:hypothetical protein
VQEEAGVSAAVIAPPGEGRHAVWLDADAASDRLTFRESRESLRKAVDAMTVT